VLWDGRVVPCCHDYDGHVVLGDLREESLSQIWDGVAGQRFRDRNYESEFCRQCAFSLRYREQQREREGFLEFHRERADPGSNEWINPASAGWRDGLGWLTGSRFSLPSPMPNNA
jgi:hypothetical protein